MTQIWRHPDGTILTNSGRPCRAATYPCECCPPAECPCPDFTPASFPCNGMLEEYLLTATGDGGLYRRREVYVAAGCATLNYAEEWRLSDSWTLAWTSKCRWSVFADIQRRLGSVVSGSLNWGSWVDDTDEFRLTLRSGYWALSSGGIIGQQTGCSPVGNYPFLSQGECYGFTKNWIWLEVS